MLRFILKENQVMKIFILEQLEIFYLFQSLKKTKIRHLIIPSPEILTFL